MPKPRPPRPWDARRVRALRRHLGLSQDALAGELGTRQQTVSEWETGQYQPRGASVRLLTIVAERAGFEYEAVSRMEEEGSGRREEGGSPRPGPTTPEDGGADQPGQTDVE
jgi:transcriptional regulator with XRE-family HTH domain